GVGAVLGRDVDGHGGVRAVVVVADLVGRVPRAVPGRVAGVGAGVGGVVLVQVYGRGEGGGVGRGLDLAVLVLQHPAVGGHGDDAEQPDHAQGEDDNDSPPSAWTGGV